MKAILFVRVSTEQQTLEQQEDELRRYARQNGYRDKDLIVIKNKESAIKLSIEERQGIQQLKSTIESDSTINAVFIYELSRISRQATMMLMMRDYFIERNVNLICMKPELRLLARDGSADATATMLLTFYAGIVENEMKLSKSRMVRGKHFRQNAGYYCGGELLYGYLKDNDNKIYVDDTKRTIINDIFERCANGEPLWAMCGQYEREGTIEGTQRSIFCKLRRMIANKSYSGRSESHTQYPAIVSCDLQDKAAQKLHCRDKSHTGQAPALLQGMIYDVETGRRFTQRKCTKQYFIDYDNGTVRSVSMKHIEQAVFEFVKKHIISTQPDDERNMKRIIDDNIKRKTNELKRIKSKYATYDSRVERMNELYVSGQMTQRQYSQMQVKLTGERRDLLMMQSQHLSELTKLYKQKDNVKAASNVQYDTLTQPQRRKLICECMRRIETKWIKRGHYIFTIYFIDDTQCKFEYICVSKKFSVREI